MPDLFGNDEKAAVWSAAEQAFEAARLKYRQIRPNGIRGHDTEWKEFCRLHRDARQVAPLLSGCIDVVLANRKAQQEAEGWSPPMVNWPTFVGRQRKWEEGLQPAMRPTQTSTSKPGRPKFRLNPIPGKTCTVSRCQMPAVYKASSGAYDFYYCREHMPEKVKKVYE